MNLRQKILLLATIPLVLAIGMITWIANYQAAELSRQEIAIFEQTMLKTKKAELLNYVSLALTSIEHLYKPGMPGSPENEETSKQLAKQVLNRLSFGPDGYFFVYDFKGRNLVHPKQPWRVGKDYWELEDKEGRKVIQNLIQQARQGGGYYRYSWEKPSSAQVGDKIGYAVALDRWGWMLGTGIYIDDVVTQVAQAEMLVNERIHETFLMISLVTLGAVLAVFLTFLAINVRETQLADRKLQLLTQKIVETQEEERGRVARELHDGISQLLVSIKFTLEHAKIMLSRPKGDATDSIDRAAKNLNLAIREVRQISHDLRPGVLDDLGLARALKNLGDDFSSRSGIAVSTRTVAFKNLLSFEAKTTLYRIAQEALTNIERHSNATRAEIGLSLSRNGVTLRIADNGEGFDCPAEAAKSKSSNGIGLKNMQERLEPFDGQLKIASGSSGTIVEACLPRKVLDRAVRSRAEVAAAL